MVAGCGNKTVKFLVFFFNFLIFVAGAVILGVSVAAAVDKSFLNDISKALEDVKEAESYTIKDYTTVFYVTAGIGGFLMCVGFLGCCGAACENRLLLGLFFLIVLILTIAQIGCAIAAFVLKDKFKNAVNKELSKIWDAEGGKEAMHGIEDAFKCCGVNDGDTDTYCHGSKKNYTKGCSDAIWDIIKKNSVLVGAIAIVVVIVEVLAMIFTCVLCSAYSRRDGYYA